MAESNPVPNNSAIDEIKTALVSLMQKGPVAGETWYLIDTRWYAQLKCYLGITETCSHNNKYDRGDDPSSHPGPIDNSQLFDGPEIKEQLIEDLDYVLAPEDAWKLLVDKFGLTTGQQPIARKVIEHGMFVKHCKVEVYYFEFNLIENSNPDEVVKKKFSKSDTIDTIEKHMRKIFNIDPSVETKLWNKYTTATYEQLTKLDMTVQDAGLYPGQIILIEKKLPNGTWARNSRSTSSALGGNPSENSSSTVSSSQSSSTSTTTNGPSTTTGAVEKKEKSLTWNEKNQATVPAAPSAPSPSTSTSTISTRNGTSHGLDGGGSTDRSKPGLCGLSNLGNTCFMNSIIQGLSNTPPIMEYFANDNYVEDINENNPLGNQGEIARTFGELIKSMWSGKYSYVVPRNFKQAVGRFAPQFSGYQQHDSHELLGFLLDGLHEDLNRVKQKPYIVLKDSENRADDEVASETWEIYKARNDSVILDLFHGLLKSTVVCPECSKVSVTFDPFCHLSLPLPVKKDRHIEVFVVYRDPNKCLSQYKVTCPKAGNMTDLCVALSKLTGIDAKKMYVTDVYNHRFHKIYSPDEVVSQILDRDDIFVYEVSTTDESNNEILMMPVYLRERRTNATYAPAHLFGQPLLVAVPRHGTDYEKLYELVLRQLSRYVTPPSSDEEWWKESKPSEKTNGVASSTSTSETVMNIDEDSKPDASSEPSTSKPEEDESMADEEDEGDAGKGPPKLFTMSFVNSCGNAQLEPLNNDGKEIKFSSKNYIAIDWHPKAKELFYNEKASEDVIQDESLHKVSQKKQTVRLDECLELYTTVEKLGESDAWYCPSCKKDQQATKKFDLWSLPAILVISLKRFSYNRYWRDKLDTFVDFPTRNLDMSPYVINAIHGQAIYDLIAVSNHYGGMGGGHYTAYAKNQFDGRWYHFDDSTVTAIKEEDAVTKAAYVLFYQRRDMTSMTSPSATMTSSLNGTNGDASSEEEMDTTN